MNFIDEQKGYISHHVFVISPLSSYGIPFFRSSDNNIYCHELHVVKRFCIPSKLFTFHSKMFKSSGEPLLRIKNLLFHCSFICWQRAFIGAKYTTLNSPETLELKLEPFFSEENRLRTLQLLF